MYACLFKYIKTPSRELGSSVVVFKMILWRVCMYLYYYICARVNPIYSNSLQVTPIHSNSLKFTPIHSITPIHSNLLQFTPIHSNSLQLTPIHSISLQFSPIQSSLLQSTPILSISLQFAHTNIFMQLNQVRKHCLTERWGAGVEYHFQEIS